MAASKILSFFDAPAVLEKVRAGGKKVVQCHGTFDFVHPGHIYHLEEAKELGDVLVVTITGEGFVNKGPGRPYFNDQLRSKSLAALECVDYVVVVPHPAAVEAIECVRPHVYCKGREYADAGNDVTGNIVDDVRTVEKFGGQVRYLGSVVFSSTKLINNNFNHLPASVKEMCRELAKTYPPERLKEEIDGFAGLRVLVIGDLIFDRYSYLRVQGLTSKNRILSGRYLEEETHGGGSIAVLKHIAQFTPHVRLIGLAGTEAWSRDLISRHLLPEQDLVVRDESFTTIVKQRFVEPTGEGKELGKLFAVNYIDAEPPPRHIQDRLLAEISKALPEADLVVVADFGHGTMQESVRAYVQQHAPFLALNCQTNSNNHGFNIISRQYQKVDCFSLDDQELLLSCASRHIDHVKELQKLRSQLQASSAWLTRGAIETIGLEEGRKPVVCLPLQTSVRDTVGAGDAFFSIAALAAVRKLPIEVSVLLGQLAGGQAVKIVGNAEPISKATLLKGAMTLVSF